jgi:hypothetical protein
MAVCHGASLAAHWRIPATSGPGAETLGYSLIKGQNATGFPERDTQTFFNSLDVHYREADRLTITSPYAGWTDDNDQSNSGKGDSKIITVCDWYPQTIAHAARALMNIIETYPSIENRQKTISVLILHGGALNPNNCSYLSRNVNDVPCNYGTQPQNLPVDYTQVKDVIDADSANDDFHFSVTAVNLTASSLPYDANDTSAIENYFSQFDAIIFFKHWSTGVTDTLQNALVHYADNGGGVLGLHHGLYNDIDENLNNASKTILVQQLFGAQSAEANWSGSLYSYQFISTNHGHFISSFGIPYTNTAIEAPAPWLTNAPLNSSNLSYSTYQNFSIFDEIYNNMAFEPTAVFGRGVNEITPIFSNNYYAASLVHTTGFVKLFNPSGDASIGRVAYFQAGERKESVNINHPYGQVIRNSLVWLAVHPTFIAPP